MALRRRQTAVVNCSHAVQEKKDEEQTNEVKDRYFKTSEEGLAGKAGNGSEENRQEKTIEEEDIVEKKSSTQEENPGAPRTTVGVFLRQRRRKCLWAIGRLRRSVPCRAGGLGKRR